MSVTDIYERSCIWQFGLHQEILCPLCWVEVGLSCYSLHFLDLASFGCSFNVLIVDLRVLTETQKASHRLICRYIAEATHKPKVKILSTSMNMAAIALK